MTAIDSDEDLTKELQPLSYHVSHRKRVLSEAFRALKGRRLEAMIPPSLKSWSRSKLESTCLSILEDLDDETLLAILDGRIRPTGVAVVEQTETHAKAKNLNLKKLQKSEYDTSTTTSDDDNDEPKKKKKKKVKDTTEEQEELRAAKLKKKKKLAKAKLKEKVKKMRKKAAVASPEAEVPPAPAPHKSLMELLELDYRAKAIKALLRSQGKFVPDIPLNIDDVENQQENVIQKSNKSLPQCNDSPDPDPGNSRSSATPVDTSQAQSTPNIPLIIIDDDESQQASPIQKSNKPQPQINNSPDPGLEKSGSSATPAVSAVGSQGLSVPDVTLIIGDGKSQQESQKSNKALPPINGSPDSGPGNSECSTTPVDSSTSPKSKVPTDPEESPAKPPAAGTSLKPAQILISQIKLASETKPTSTKTNDEVQPKPTTEPETMPKSSAEDEESEGEEDVLPKPVTWYERWTESHEMKKVVKTNQIHKKVRSKLKQVRSSKKQKPEPPKVPEPSIETEPIIGSIEEYEKLFGKKVSVKNSDGQGDISASGEDEIDDDTDDLWGDIIG